jgi:endogenous inhibitor of DNA gyrase (YacG/DUF329 family)
MTLPGAPTDKVTPLRPRRPCPECGRPCKDIDLNRWLSGAYVLPGREEEPSGSESDDG